MSVQEFAEFPAQVESPESIASYYRDPDRILYQATAETLGNINALQAFVTLLLMFSEPQMQLYQTDIIRALGNGAAPVNIAPRCLMRLSRHCVGQWRRR